MFDATMVSGTTALVVQAVGYFVVGALAVFAVVGGVQLGIMLFKWGMKKLRGSTYDYMDSYKNANLGGVYNAVLRSKGNNSSQW